MNLLDLNYLEPFWENKGIRGGISTYTYTKNTFSAASASTSSSGDVAIYSVAGALGEATGYITSVYTLTDTSTLGHIFNVATANGKAGAISFGPRGYELSRSIATSLTTSNPDGHITTEFAVSSSMSSY